MTPGNIARIAGMTKRASEGIVNISDKIGRNQASSSALAGLGTIAATGDPMLGAAAGLMIGGTSMILNRTVSELKSMTDLTKINEAKNLIKGFTGEGTPVYDSLAYGYAAAGTFAVSAATFGAIHSGMDPSHIAQSGILGAGFGLGLGGFKAGAGFVNDKLKTLAAKNSNPVVDAALGKLNIGATKKYFKKITGKDFPPGLGDMIRDEQPLINPDAKYFASAVAGLGNTGNETTLWKKTKGAAARIAFPVTEFMSGGMKELVEDSIHPTINSGMNVLLSQKVPIINQRVGPLEPMLTSKLHLGVAAAGIATIGAIGSDISMYGNPAMLSAGMASVWGAGSLLQSVPGLFQGIGMYSGLPGQAKDLSKSIIKKTIGITTDMSKLQILRKTGSSAISGVNFGIKNGGGKIIKKSATGIFNYIKDGNAGAVSTGIVPGIEEIMDRNLEIGSSIGRKISEYLPESARLKLARKEIELRRRS